MKVGDIVLLKEDWQASHVDYGYGIITRVAGGISKWDGEPWESFCVQWNDDFTWHEQQELELISET